jgi:hypothetical protein
MGHVLLCQTLGFTAIQRQQLFGQADASLDARLVPLICLTAGNVDQQVGVN